MIMTVKGYSHKESKRVDEQRSMAELPTRKGAKKSVAVSFAPEQAIALMTQPETLQGRRDALLMCLLLEHGLRVGEVALLGVKDFDLKAGTLTFYPPRWTRPKRINFLGECCRLGWVVCSRCTALLGHPGGSQQYSHWPSTGGWNSPAMPLRYVETAKIANEGVNLG